MSSSRGWEAIDARLARLYPGLAPLHFGTVMRYAEGGPDPLDGVSIYAASGHWHFVSYGMSELYDKTSDVKSRSGWGFEFTFRLARGRGKAPPKWPIALLQSLARYVFDTRRPFAEAHYVDYGRPITGGTPRTALAALVFAADPELRAFRGPNGRVAFLQAIGITAAEHSRLSNANSARFVAAMQKQNPLLVTAIDRLR